MEIDLEKFTPLEKALCQELFNTAAIYQTGQSESELALVAVLFAEALEEDAGRYGFGVIQRAFALHRKTSKRFPTPAHILELLPQCHSRPPVYVELAEKPETQTPGFPRIVGLARKGNAEAKALMQKHREKPGDPHVRAAMARLLDNLRDSAA